MVDDRAAAKELDQWIDQLMDCKPLTEAQVKTLCDKVREQFFLHRYLLFLVVSVSQFIVLYVLSAQVCSCNKDPSL